MLIITRKTDQSFRFRRDICVLGTSNNLEGEMLIENATSFLYNCSNNCLFFFTTLLLCILLISCWWEDIIKQFYLIIYRRYLKKKKILANY